MNVEYFVTWYDGHFTMWRNEPHFDENLDGWGYDHFDNGEALNAATAGSLGIIPCGSEPQIWRLRCAAEAI